MKEEIGKIIDKNIDNNFTFEKNAFKNNQYCLADEIWNILDKYDNQPDYKSAFEYMYNWFNQRNPKKDTEDSLKIENFVINFMNEMIKKYNLGGD